MIRVALDGLRSRSLLSLGTLLLLVVALGSAVLGPAFAAAVGNAYAVTRLEEERNVLTGRTWEVRPSGAVDDPGALLDDTLDQLVLPDDQHAASAQLETSRELAPGALGEVMLMAKPDACAHLDVEGRCPEAPGEVAVLAGDAEEDGYEIGDRIELGPPFGTLTLVGTYAYPSGPSVPSERREELADYWFEPARLASVPATVRPGRQLTEIARQPAPYLVAPDQLSGLSPSLVLVRVDSRIDVPTDLDAADLPALAHRELLRCGVGGRRAEGPRPGAGLAARRRPPAHVGAGAERAAPPRRPRGPGRCRGWRGPHLGSRARVAAR